MIRRPPRSTLFPYTSSSDLCPSAARSGKRISRPARAKRKGVKDKQAVSQLIDFASVRFSEPRSLRSEEHTSELQSQSNLVCRLLLEKKTRTRSLVSNFAGQ